MKQLTGKYSGLEFEDILEKDLPYCEFMLSLKFVKAENEAFIEFLQANIDSARLKKRVAAIARLR